MTSNQYHQRSVSTILFVASIFALILSIFLVENEGGISTLSLVILIGFLVCSLLRPNLLLTELVTFTGLAVVAGHLFYLMPISHIGLRMDDPYALYDSQKYALSAQMALQGGDGLGHWMSFGIEQYLISIYKAFGVEESNVLAANALLFAGSLLLLFRSVTGTARNQLARGVLVLCGAPLTVFYVGQGSKEALCIFTTSLFLFSIAPPSAGKHYVILGVLTIILTLFIRPSLAALYLIFWFGMRLRLRRLFSWDLVYALPLTVLLVASAVVVSGSVLGLDLEFWLDYGGILFDTSTRLATAAASGGAEEPGIAYQIKAALSPENKIMYTAFTPLKMILVWVAPFPAIANPFSLPATPTGLSTYVYSLITFVSSILNVSSLPAIFYLLLKSRQLSDNDKTILYFILFYLAAIAFSYPTQFTRHRVLIEIPTVIIVLKNIGIISSIYSLYFKTMIKFLGAWLVVMTIIVNFSYS